MDKVIGTEANRIELGGGVNRVIHAYGDDLMAVEVIFETGATGAVHQHAHAQVSYIIEGEFEFVVDGVVHHVQKGDSLYFAPNMPHGGTCLEAGKVLDVFTPMRKDFV